MTDIIYDRAAVRENTIWDSFQFNGPFGAIQAEERTILFGLYANTYLHGQNYLNEIETEDLAKLVDTYTLNMAQLTNDEAQTVLDIAAKRYVEGITQQIHAADIVTRGQKLDSLDAEYDAKTEALDADYAALETQRQKVALAWDKAAQKIKDLQMRVELETVNQQFVEVDITEQELKAARADLAVIEAGLKGLDIQLAITETGIKITNTNLEITEADSRVDEIGIQVAETEVQESGVDLDITNAGISLSKAEAQGERTKVDTKGVAIRVAETEFQTVETEAKKSQIDAEISKINADTARLALVDSELTIVQADKRVTQAENELLVQDKYMIDSQGENVTAETDFRNNQKDIQEDLDEKNLDQDQSEHDFAMEMSQKETEFEDGMKDKKVELLAGAKRDLVDNIRETKYEDAQDKADQLDVKARAQELYKDAAIEAAQLLADANLMTTLTHSVGEGTAPTPTTQTWSNITMT